MPDISMCYNINCKKRFSCYRYIVKPDEYWQSYAYFNKDSQDKCHYYHKAKFKVSKDIVYNIDEQNKRRFDI